MVNVDRLFVAAKCPWRIELSNGSGVQEGPSWGLVALRRISRDGPIERSVNFERKRTDESPEAGDGRPRRAWFIHVSTARSEIGSYLPISRSGVESLHISGCSSRWLVICHSSYRYD